MTPEYGPPGALIVAMILTAALLALRWADHTFRR
jgi:hypothetical protein